MAWKFGKTWFAVLFDYGFEIMFFIYSQSLIKIIGLMFLKPCIFRLYSIHTNIK